MLKNQRRANFGEFDIIKRFEMPNARRTASSHCADLFHTTVQYCNSKKYGNSNTHKMRTHTGMIGGTSNLLVSAQRVSNGGVTNKVLGVRVRTRVEQCLQCKFTW